MTEMDEQIEVFTLQQETYEEQYYQQSVIIEKIVAKDLENQIQEKHEEIVFSDNQLKGLDAFKADELGEAPLDTIMSTKP